MPQSRSQLFGDIPKRLIHFRRYSSRYTCSLCEDTLMDPIQTECGCRFCSSCIDHHIKTGFSTCPSCQSFIFPQTFIQDKAIEKEILTLEISCFNEDCEQIMILSDFEDHRNVCDFRREKCEKCGESYREKERMEHTKDICKKGIVKCNNCGLEMTREEKDDIHENLEREMERLCDKMQRKCPYECDNVEYVNVKQHLFECRSRPTSCLLLDFGCQAVISFNDISHHMERNIYEHQILMRNEINRLRKENEDLKHSFTLSNEELRKEVTFLKEMNSELMVNVKKFQEFSIESGLKIENLKSEVEMYKETIEELSANDENELSIANGECLWKINDIRQKIHNAKHGGMTEILSKPFYISTPGYKFRLKIYPNGDGKGKNNYLSIYLIIIRGDYDDGISWPFKQNFTFSILNRRGSFGDVRIRMKPDDNESCYGRPNARGNTGSGQPEFIKLSTLLSQEDFLHEGSLKIKLKMDESFQN